MALGYYTTQSTTPLLSTYSLLSFGFHARFLLLINDETSGTNTIAGSLDNSVTHFTLLPGESLVLDEWDLTSLSLKYINGAPAYRLTALQSPTSGSSVWTLL